MASREITTPSGMKGLVRGLRGKEANILADKVKARRNQTFDKILENCWMQTDDGGVLTDIYMGEGGKPKWNKVLIADRFYTLVQIRIATSGPEYEFRWKCGTCGEGQDHVVVLDKDMIAKPFDSKDLQTYLDGNRFESTMPDGKRFVFKLRNGEDEIKSSKLLRKASDELVTTSLAQAIIEIEGIEYRNRYDYLEEMEWEDQQDILELIEEHDGGYDANMFLECQECGHESEVRAPFDEHFWIRRRKRSQKAKELESRLSS